MIIRITEQETPAERARREYSRKVDGFIRRTEKVEDQAVREMIGIVDRVREQTVSVLATPTAFEAHRLNDLLAQADSASRMLQNELSLIADGAVTQSFDLGFKTAFDPVSDVVGGTISALRPDPDLLEAMRLTTADLVTDISNVTRRRINNAVRLGSTGVLRPDQAISQVAEVLKTRRNRKGDGQLGRVGVAARAEAIVRTEVPRIHTVAQFRTMTDLADQLPDAEKQWITRRDGRQRSGPNASGVRRSKGNHDILHEQKRAMDQVFANGLRFPRDPAGPPHEVIQCRCSMVMDRPDWTAPPVMPGILS